MPDQLRLVMLGTGTFAEPTLRALLALKTHCLVGLVTQPDPGPIERRGSTRQTGEGMVAIAQASSVPVFQPESINTPEGSAQLRQWNADLLVTAAYGQILKAEILESTRLGGINVHASLLPKYRGAAPVAWAIWKGETETGVTIIRMTTGLDAGGMLAKKSLRIGLEETAGELEARLSILGAALAAEVVNQLADGSITGETQDVTLVTRAPKLTKEHGLIDWAKPAIEVCRQIRAVQPWPTPYTFLHRLNKPSQRLLIPKAEPRNENIGTPGEIIIRSNEVLVSCGEGAVAILEVQPAGKKRMSVLSWLNGRPAQTGDRFGPA